jgi:predicted HTH transcriptional regulator
VTVENILAEQASRNPVILSILYESGYVEAFGQGLDTVVAVLSQEDLPPPHFHDPKLQEIISERHPRRRKTCRRPTSTTLAHRSL